MSELVPMPLQKQFIEATEDIVIWGGAHSSGGTWAGCRIFENAMKVTGGRHEKALYLTRPQLGRFLRIELPMKQIRSRVRQLNQHTKQHHAFMSWAVDTVIIDQPLAPVKGVHDGDDSVVKLFVELINRAAKVRIITHPATASDYVKGLVKAGLETGKVARHRSIFQDQQRSIRVIVGR